MNGSGVTPVAALYELSSDLYHRIKRRVRNTETLTDFIDIAIERELQERETPMKSKLPKFEHYAYQVWVRYASGQVRCLASGATSSVVAGAYVYSCETSGVETVLVVNWATGGDPKEGALRTIVSRSEGSTLELKDCIETEEVA